MSSIIGYKDIELKSIPEESILGLYVLIMKLFGKSKTNSNNKDSKTILFVCVENTGRSQMAEGFSKRRIL